MGGRLLTVLMPAPVYSTTDLADLMACASCRHLALSSSSLSSIYTKNIRTHSTSGYTFHGHTPQQIIYPCNLWTCKEYYYSGHTAKCPHKNTNISKDNGVKLCWQINSWFINLPLKVCAWWVAATCCVSQCSWQDLAIVVTILFHLWSCPCHASSKSQTPVG